MSFISPKTEVRQQLQLTPQLLQSMELLQMNSPELLEYLNKITEENPVLECMELLCITSESMIMSLLIRQTDIIWGVLNVFP